MESNIKYINSISLFGIACSLVTMIYLYKTDFSIKHAAEMKSKESEIQAKESEIHIKESELHIKEKNLDRALNDLKIKEEIILNMEKSFSKNNDQLNLLISSINNFAMASDKIVKAYDDNFCVISK